MSPMGRKAADDRTAACQCFGLVHRRKQALSLGRSGRSSERIGDAANTITIIGLEAAASTRARGIEVQSWPERDRWSEF